jgi:hypothetical protein
MTFPAIPRRSQIFFLPCAYIAWQLVDHTDEIGNAIKRRGPTPRSSSALQALANDVRLRASAAARFIFDFRHEGLG